MTDTKTPIIFAPSTYQYDKDSLDITDVDSNPIEQFHKWFDDAQKSGEPLVESTNFSTAQLPSGRVSSRVVLMKELDDTGFVIYTNLRDSKKGHDIQTNKYASLTFFWKILQRQVRVEGVIEYVSKETNQRYFNTRPRGSRIGAWSSPQSHEIKGREEFEEVYKRREKEFEGIDEIPCPDYWGGIRIVPVEIEFWQGRPSRLHDRITFRRDSTTTQEWKITRIAP